MARGVVPLPERILLHREHHGRPVFRVLLLWPPAQVRVTQHPGRSPMGSARKPRLTGPNAPEAERR